MPASAILTPREPSAFRSSTSSASCAAAHVDPHPTRPTRPPKSPPKHPPRPHPTPARRIWLTKPGPLALSNHTSPQGCPSRPAPLADLTGMAPGAIT
jgi:hypothetical protein